MSIYFWVVCFVYVAYVSIESLGMLARSGGYKISGISIGLALQNQILSLNRFIGFLVAPMIGYYVDKGATVEDVYALGIVGTIFGGLSLLFVFVTWNSWIGLFSSVAHSILTNGYNIKSIFRLNEKNNSEVIFDADSPKFKFKKNFFFAQLVTTGLAMPSLFVLNIAAVNNPEYSATLLQMTTAISGIGNLLLNFYTIPLLSVSESRKEEVDNVYKSIFLGKVVGICILSPLVITAGVMI